MPTGIYLLSEVLAQFKQLLNLTSNDAIIINRYYDNNSPDYPISIVYNYKGQSAANSFVTINKESCLLTEFHIDEKNTDLITYVTDIQNNGILITADITSLIPNKYSSYIVSNDKIFYVADGTDGFNVYVYDNAYNLKFEVKEEAPFESIIYGKPLDQSNIFKQIARRLVIDGFELVHKDVLINTHPVTRIYVYRDIYFCFYKDYAVYVGFSSTDDLPSEWEEFTNLNENSLDTTIRDYLINNWYNPEA